MMDLKMEQLDLDLFNIAYMEYLKAKKLSDHYDAVVMGHLGRVAESKGLDLKTYRFNLSTQSFELRAGETTT